MHVWQLIMDQPKSVSVQEKSSLMQRNFISGPTDQCPRHYTVQSISSIIQTRQLRFPSHRRGVGRGRWLIQVISSKRWFSQLSTHWQIVYRCSKQPDSATFSKGEPEDDSLKPFGRSLLLTWTAFGRPRAPPPSCG